MNRLSDATSPYLLQHAGQPGGLVALVRRGVRARPAPADVPVLLSVGYSACHWCHVMAHESFEDPADRRVAERAPGGDQGGPGGAARRGRGLHDRHPGHDRPGRLADDRVHDPGRRAVLLRHLLPPGLLPALVLGVAKAWRERPRQRHRPGRAGSPPRWPSSAAPLRGAAATAGQGGRGHSGGGPGRLLRRGGRRRWPRTTTAGAAGSAARRSSRRRWCWSSCSATTQRTGEPRDALRLAAGTCEAMARGGMYDQLGGGFARYSVDADWVVPHFEKMLYDNALLARVYAHLWRRTGVRAGPPGGRGDLRLDARASCAPPRAVSRPRWTPTARARRDSSTSGPPAELRGSTRAVTTPSTRRRRSASPRPARSSTAARCCSCRADPADAGAVRAGPAGPARRPRAAGSARAATTRWSRPGTGWPSPRWPSAGCCSPSRTSSRPRRDAAGLLARVHLARRAAGPDLAGRGGRDRARACSRTTPAWPRACWPCPG